MKRKDNVKKTQRAMEMAEAKTLNGKVKLKLRIAPVPPPVRAILAFAIFWVFLLPRSDWIHEKQKHSLTIHIFIFFH